MKSVLIIAGGVFCEIPKEMQDEINACDTVIAADSGFENAMRYGIKPDIFLGDMDSVKTDASINYTKMQTIILPTKKDETDTMYAVKYAILHGSINITILCGFGGRLDHSFATIQAAVFAKNANVCVKVIGVGGVLFVVKNENLELRKFENFNYFSVFSYSQKSTGVTITNAEYCTEDAILKNDFPLGCSNQWQTSCPTATVSVDDGTLLVIVS